MIWGYPYFWKHPSALSRNTSSSLVLLYVLPGITNLRCDIFQMTTIETYQYENLIALRQSINIFKWFPTYLSSTRIRKIRERQRKKNKVYLLCKCWYPPPPSSWSWPSRPCWLENQHLTAHSPSTLLAQCLTKPGMWRCFGAWPKPKVLELFRKGH